MSLGERMPALMQRTKPRDPAVWGNVTIGPGESHDVAIEVSESFSGMTVKIPVHVRRGLAEGPTVFVTAAVHGDEINGTGAIRSLIAENSLTLKAGILILVPVVNVVGFDRHSRYLPDRRDLNRCFPGSATGSLASRMAHVVFNEIVGRCDCGIDLHTAAVRRTNFPNVRADMSDPVIHQLAEAFGCEVLVNMRSPKGALRRAACRAGCPTFILEAGEVWKVERTVVQYALRGIHNVLSHLGMWDGPRDNPSHRVIIERTKWVRADTAGFLRFHVGPGGAVEAGQPLATSTSLLGRAVNTILSPFDGIVLGMTTLPVAAPGEPVCQIGLLPKDALGVKGLVGRLSQDALHQRVRDDLATNFTLFEPAGD